MTKTPSSVRIRYTSCYTLIQCTAAIYPLTGIGTFGLKTVLYIKVTTLFKRIPFTDVGLWSVLAINIYLIYSYIQTPAIIDTIVFLFYIQSVCIGIFNALDIFTVTNIATNAKADNMFSSRGCAGVFFIFHYGMFHVVYLVFLSGLLHFKTIDYHFFMLSFYILLTSCLISFIQDKVRNRTEAIDISSMFFMPYVRIVPIHLMILIPAFLHISAPLIFLVLKTVGDIITQVVYKKAVFKPIVKKVG